MQLLFLNAWEYCILNQIINFVTCNLYVQSTQAFLTHLRVIIYGDTIWNSLQSKNKKSLGKSFAMLGGELGKEEDKD